MTPFPVTVVFDGMQRDINDVHEAKEYIVRFQENIDVLKSAIVADESAATRRLVDSLNQRVRDKEIIIVRNGYTNAVAFFGEKHEFYLNKDGGISWGDTERQYDSDKIHVAHRFYLDAPPELLYERKDG